MIPGNLHFKSPNTDIPGLSDGKLQVVTQNTEWGGGFVGVNSFGFGGSNVHSVLRSNNNYKTSHCEGCEKKRLFNYCSRTEQGLKDTLQKVRLYPHDVYLHSLMNETSNMTASTHPYRGYTVLNGPDDIHVQVYAHCRVFSKIVFFLSVRFFCSSFFLQNYFDFSEQCNLGT